MHPLADLVCEIADVDLGQPVPADGSTGEQVC